MSRRHRHHREPPELDITAFLNLMVVLVPFLLITAVFSRITILQLNLPSGSGASEADDKKLTIEVIVRSDRIELGDGGQLIMLPFMNTPEGEYNITRLAQALGEIKDQHPNKLDATVLMEPDLEYEVLVKVMDAVSGSEIPEEDGTVTKRELFPQISVGDAPTAAKSSKAPASTYYRYQPNKQYANARDTKVAMLV